MTLHNATLQECLKFLKEIQSRVTSEDNANRLHHAGAAPSFYSHTALVLLKVVDLCAAESVCNIFLLLG